MSRILGLSDLNPTLIEHARGKSEAARARLFSKLSRKEVAAQIRQLRERRDLTQIKFAKLVRMKKSAVSRIEQEEYSGWNYKTLARIAEKLHARLRITFEPLEDVIAEMATESDAGHPSEDVVGHQTSSVDPVQATTLGANQDEPGERVFSDPFRDKDWSTSFPLVNERHVKRDVERAGDALQ